MQGVQVLDRFSVRNVDNVIVVNYAPVAPAPAFCQTIQADSTYEIRLRTYLALSSANCSFCQYPIVVVFISNFQCSLSSSRSRYVAFNRNLVL